MITVTTRQVLSECLVIFEARSRSVSKNLANLEPQRGYELQFDLEQARCQIIRKLMRAVERGAIGDTDPEQRPPADWQKEIMNNPQQEPRMDL
jgi:hypothetical protein